MVVDEIQIASGPGGTAVRPAPVTLADERAARRSLREQIGRLEGKLAACVAEAFPTGDVVDVGTAVHGGGPRLLSLGELEAARDDLAARVRGARDRLARQGETHERNRVLLERVRLDPKRHKFVRIPRESLGIPGCGAYEVRPRLGVVGMLLGWWQVKLSSGCPLGVPEMAEVAISGGPPDRLRCRRWPRWPSPAGPPIVSGAGPRR